MWKVHYHVVRQVCLEEDFDGGGGDDDLLHDFPDARQGQQQKQKWETMMFCFKSSVDIIQWPLLPLALSGRCDLTSKPQTSKWYTTCYHFPPPQAPVQRHRTMHDESALGVYYVRLTDSAFFIRMTGRCVLSVGPPRGQFHHSSRECIHSPPPTSV